MKTRELSIVIVCQEVEEPNELMNLFLLHFRRNDYISSVREAAQVALEQIGGEEANKAMHMTKVLAEEIRKLTNE